MRTLLVATLALLVPVAAAQDSEDIESKWDRWQLFNGCPAMRLEVEVKQQVTVTGYFGLSKAGLLEFVESRLRAERLYTSDAEVEPYLYVSVAGAQGNLEEYFTVTVTFYKPLTDVASGVTVTVDSWESEEIQKHNNDRDYVLYVVTKHLDKFLDAYLRVNKASCEGP